MFLADWMCPLWDLKMKARDNRLHVIDYHVTNVWPYNHYIWQYSKDHYVAWCFVSSLVYYYIKPVGKV